MKPLFVLLFFWLWLNQGNSQHWNSIKQASLGITYDLPQAWYVGGHTNKKACDCVGASVNSSPEGALSMMVVVGKEAQDKLLKQAIWGYEFIPTTPAQKKIQLENITFERSISTWKQSPKEIVLRFVNQEPINGQTYILYFWGSFEAIQQYKEVIEKIMTSFKPYQYD
ncbi:MAG: hypothetical protein ACRBFS_21910 [Aureispira sp.]